ncbi:unnamed protein product [Penicillium salamii]|nr:unnamed protein product [Penicillium salamii]CAG8313842.1 unnamed protein product [Penicillium salamii]
MASRVDGLLPKWSCQFLLICCEYHSQISNKAISLMPCTQGIHSLLTVLNFVGSGRYNREQNTFDPPSISGFSGSYALDALCTQEQLDLLDSVDTLRSQGISHYVSLPQIIVCGDQSSGKRSVLEAISGVSFPVGVRVSIVPHQSRSEAEQRSLSSFCEQLDGFDGFAILIENAKAAMGISTHGKAVSNDLLRVEISGPDRPHLTIVDLPGLIHSETRQQSAADVQLVQSVVQSYMSQPRSIILAVVSAKNDFANQIVLRLARDADPSGNRTLAVITKPDILVAGSESEASFISLAKNQDVEFRLGWHVLKNMDSEKGHWNLSERDVKEWEFFSRGIWEDMPRSLVAELPSLIEDINAKSDACRAQLSKLGQPRATLDAQRSYLFHISQLFQSLVKTAVDGTYNETFFGNAQTDIGYKRRIRAVIQNLNAEFAANLARYGHYRQLDPLEENNSIGEHQILMSRDDYLEDIATLLERTRGRELPGTYDPMITRDLFQDQSRPWDGISRNHVIAAWAAAKDFLQQVVNHVADEATSTALFEKVIVPALSELRENLEQGTAELLTPHQQRHPITYDHYFTETLQHTRNGRQREQLREALKRHFTVDHLSSAHAVDYSIDLRALLDSLVWSTVPNMTQFASEEALDCMLAYYKVALKRFVDDIATKVVEMKLLCTLPEIFTPVTAFDMSDELVMQFAGESEESRTLREQLNKKLNVLAKGSDTCR